MALKGVVQAITMIRIRLVVQGFLSYAAFAEMLTLGLFARPAAADQVEYSRVSEIEVLNDSAVMYFHKYGVITSVTGPVGREGIPQRIRLGDVITVKDRTILVGVIEVTAVLEDIVWQGELVARKGDVLCDIAASPDELPSGRKLSYLWINVTECRPLE